MRKSGCNKRKLHERAKLRNGDISLFQRFLKMGVSTADCIRQTAKSIPELLSHKKEHGYELQIIRQQRASGLRSISRHDDLRRGVGMGITEGRSAESL